jgi:hypothetical protein
LATPPYNGSWHGRILAPAAPLPLGIGLWVSPKPQNPIKMIKFKIKNKIIKIKSVYFINI